MKDLQYLLLGILVGLISGWFRSYLNKRNDEERAELQEEVYRIRRIREEMKVQWGVHTNISFDDVWKEALALKKADGNYYEEINERLRKHAETEAQILTITGNFPDNVKLEDRVLALVSSLKPYKERAQNLDKSLTAMTTALQVVVNDFSSDPALRDQPSTKKLSIYLAALNQRPSVV